MISSKKLKVACILGTRPEAVKMAPVILELRARSQVEVVTISTGQHRDIIQPILSSFSVEPDYDLEIMKPGQSLEEITIVTLTKLSGLLDIVKPDLLIVQGDTTTAYVAALCAFYKKIKVAHVEAGLRSYSKDEPFPEEVNRCGISKIADFHFAPTELNRNALLEERVDPKTVLVTGNTVVDALLMQIKRLGNKFNNPELASFFSSPTRKIIVTAHRRENFGQGILNICEAVEQIAHAFSDVEFLIPVHPNPLAREPIKRILGECPRVRIIDPLNYFDFIQAMNNSYLILTDSGGVQEEAPSIGKPVLVLRNITERPEGVEGGTAKLLGTDVEKIVFEVSELLSEPMSYHKMASNNNPYGDGRASKRIVDCLVNSRI